MFSENHQPSWKQINKMIESYISSPLVKSFLAGSLSGTCSTIIFQPLDLAKTRIQCAVKGSSNQSTGLMAVVINVVKNEHLSGLWKGVIPSLSRTVPGIGVYFSSLHWLRNNIGSSDPVPLESFLMGVTARSISGVSMLPFTVVKTRFESGNYNYKGVGNALVTIYKGEGAKGLFGGLSATLLRDAPFSGLYLMFYTQCKKGVSNSGVIDNPHTPPVHFACGIVAGCLASVVTQPPDVVKTLMQTQPEKFPTAHSCIVYIYQNDGMQGFLRGIVPRCLRRSLMAALAWTVYEQMMRSFGITGK